MRLDQVFGFLVILLAIYLGVQATGRGSVDSSVFDSLRSGVPDSSVAEGGTLGDGGALADRGTTPDGDGTRTTDDVDDVDDVDGGSDGANDNGGGRTRSESPRTGANEAVIVESSFCSAAPARSSYDDLGTAHDAAIRCIEVAGIMTGTSATDFDPGAALTRGQAAAAIAAMIDTAKRLEATDVDLRGLPSADDARFEDVTPATPHEMAIARLNETPILRGYVDARYEPGGKVTRGQMASMLDRTYQYVNRAALPIGRDRFVDDDRSVHEESINSVAGARIMYGVGNQRFAPGRSVRRGQMASYLARMMVRMEDKGRIRPLPAP